MKKVWFALLLVFAFSSGLYAQSTGTINGRVTDPTGGVVAGATVTATNAGTGIARTTVTDSSGVYSIPELTPGMYNVKAAVTGFANSEKDGETLVTSTVLTVNFELGLASTAAKVEVTSEAPMVELTQSVVSGTLQTSEVENLPILNRNFSGLITLIPSARPTLTPANNKISLGGGLGFSGGAGRNGAAEVDGVAFRDDANGGPLFNVTLEGVQEFNVIAHDFPAQYGLTSGGIVLITTKSGGNNFHGSLFGFGRNQDMTAIDYFSEPANGGSGKPPYDREELGGSFGGRIIKDKLFFFEALEHIRLDQAIEWPGSVYNQAVLLKTNLMSLTTCPICVTVGNAIQPALSAPETLRDFQTSVRVDYQINNKHSLFARWMQEHINTFDDILEIQGGVPHPDVDANGSNNFDPIRADNAVIAETWVLGNNSVNTFAVAGTHFYEFQYCNCTLNGASEIYRNITFPDFQVGESVNATNSEDVQDDIQIKDTFAHQAGNHALKFGGEFITYPRLGFDRAISGCTGFFADPSAILTTPSTYPQGFLTPGAMKSLVVSTINFGGPPARSRVEGGKEYSLFFQDDWKIKPRFTVNLGVRYTQFINFYNEDLQYNNRANQLLTAIGDPWGGYVRTPTTDFSPRVGFAWDLTGNGKNVLRASFGVFFDESLSANVLSIDPEDQPTLQNVTSTYSNTAVGKGAIPSAVYGGTLPTTLTPGLTTFLPGGNSTLTVLDPGMSDPYNEQTHVGFTRQLTPSTVISVDYTHILGLHEIHSEPVNPIESTTWDPNAASFNTCGIAPGTSYRRLQCEFNTITAPGTVGVVNVIGSTNRSQYNEMIVHFEQRSRIVDLQASYIYSTAYAFGGTINGTGTGGGAAAAELPFQWYTPNEWGPTSTDERDRVVISGVFKLPWGIQASPVFQYGTARPYNCLAGPDWTGSGGTTARCIMNSSGQLIAAPTSGIVGGVLPVGDSSVSYDYLRGTATYDFDARFTKVFKIRETKQLSVFAELYNLTNKANFGNNYSGTFTSALFKTPLGYLNQGLSLPTSRQLQLGARFTF